MKILTPLLLLTSFAISGCASKIVDYDGENVPIEEQQRMMENGGIVYTDKVVTLADEDGIAIIASNSSHKITFYEDYEVKQDIWNIDAHNLSDKDQCVTLQWRLMDFKFISDHPTEFYVPKNSIVRAGEMIQMVWEIQGVKFTPDGSGYLWSMGVRDPVKDAKSGDECTHILKEEDLVPDEDVYVH